MQALETVWVVYCDRDKQYSIRVPYTEGMTALQALEKSGLRSQTQLPEKLEMGIFSLKIADPEHYLLSAGDRVEIYRPLILNPQEVRRRRAQKNPVGRYRQGNQWKKSQKSTEQ